MKKIIFSFIFIMIALSCKSTKVQETAVPQSRSTSAIRLDDIQKQILPNPVNALNLIYIFKEVYSGWQDIENSEWALLLNYEKEAIESLSALQKKAIEEEEWDDVISLSRSLASVGVTEGIAGREPDFLLADARKKMSSGDTLGAFLSAVKSHEMRPMDYANALFFLEKAAEVRQRRAAAFFLLAAERAGGRNIPAALREYAAGTDTASDMIKGVATVVVDKGIRIERGRGMPDRSLGSAFFVCSSGLLITNYHVIESEVDPKFKGVSRMHIRMGDATSPRIPARVVGWDKALDLALIKAEYTSEYVFSLVDRVIPRVGDTVLAIGSPVGLEKTVTSGIVSALGRRFLQIGDVIQIDADVNHGNSGGPVVDNSGRLVGIVFAGITHHQGLNFAVPAERLAAALPAMIKGGKAQRPWIGMTLSETFSGAEVIYIAPNTPASRHLVREGSFIRTVNGITVRAPQGGLIPAMQSEIFQYGPGELVVLETIDSGGDLKRNIIMTVPRPDLPLVEAAKVDRRERIAAPLFGMVLTPNAGGIFSPNFTVRKVVRGSIADEAGISENDPVSINRLRIMENDGFAVMDITIRRRRMGYLETSMQLPAWLDSPDTF